jgi:GT2 family glycosyltransferase
MSTAQLNSKKVAIVLVNWNSFDLTKDTLESLQQTTYTNYDCIVVDNGSEDGSGDLIEKQFPNCIVLKSSTNKGFTGGNNIGIDYALQQDYEYIMMLNNDVAVEPNFLEPLIAKLDQDDSVGAVQPLIYFHHDRHLIWNAGSTYNTFLGICATPDYKKKDPQHLFRKKAKQIDWITGCAFMIRASVLKEVGLLKEAFFIYYEDVDLSFRIKAAGYELSYVPSSVIYHIAGMSHKTKEKGKEGFVSPKVHFLNARNRIWCLKEHTPVWAIASVTLFNAFYFFSIGFYFIFRARWQKLQAFKNGIIEGLLHRVS